MEETEKEVEKRIEKIKAKCLGWFKDPYNKIFFGILILAIIIRFYFFFETMHQPVWWDEADYLGESKVFGKVMDIDYAFNPRRPFLLALTFGLMFRLGFGEVSLRVLELLLSILAIPALYLVGKTLFNKEVGLISSFLLAIYWEHLFYSFRLMTEIPSLTLLLFSIYFFWEGYINKKPKMLPLFGLFFGLSVMFRAGMFAIGVSFFFFMILVDRLKFLKNKGVWAAGIIFLLIFSTFLGYIYFKEKSTNPLDRFFGVSEGRFGLSKAMGFSGIKQYALFSPVYFGTVLLIPFLFGLLLLFFDIALRIDLIWKKRSSQMTKYLFIFLWVAVPFLFHALIGDHMESRYLLSILPAFFIILSNGLIKIKELTLRYGKNIGILILIIFLLSGAYYQIKQANQTISAKSASYLEVMQSGIWLKANTPKDAIIFSESWPQHTYYSERKVYAFMSPHLNESYFEEKVKEIKPDYLVLSIFEQHAQWAYTYPQKHNDTLIPVQAYPAQTNQPTLIIYKFNYKNEDL